MDEQTESGSRDEQTVVFDSAKPKTTASRWDQRGRSSGNGTLIRLFFLVGLLVMVLWAMRVSGRAETWRWLFHEPGQQVQPANQADKSDVTEIPFDPVTRQVETLPSAANTEDSAAPAGQTDTDPALPMVVSAPQYEQEFLRRFLQSLSGSEQADFFELVQHAIRQEELPAGKTAVASSLIRQFKRSRQAWLDRWSSWGEESPINEAVRRGIAATNQVWGESVIPAFESLLTQPDPASINDPLIDFGKAVRLAADSLVEHSTQVGRPVESYAWVAAWADVFDQPMVVDPVDLPQPTITQMLGQPEVWSGQTLAIRGTALLVQRVKAGKNALGIRDYHVIWIRPEHVSSFPYCVYTLLPPESLALADGQSQRAVQTRVAAAARLFKVRMFESDGQPAQAPLLMASTVEVLPEPTKAEADPPFRFPGAGTTAGIIALVAALAAWLAWLAYRTSLGGKKRGEPAPDRMQLAMKDLQNDPQVETIREKLERLGSEHDDPT